MKVAQCSNCGQVKNIKAKGLCSNCYQGNTYWRKKHPLVSKTCAYQKCSKVFYTSDSRKIYCSRKCKNEDNRVKHKYLRCVPRGKCPNCHRDILGILRKLTISHNGIITWEKWEIQHVRGKYYKGKKRINRRVYLGSCYFDSLPIIL